MKATEILGPAQEVMMAVIMVDREAKQTLNCTFLLLLVLLFSKFPYLLSFSFVKSSPYFYCALPSSFSSPVGTLQKVLITNTHRNKHTQRIPLASYSLI